MDLIALALTAGFFLLFNLLAYLIPGRPNLLSLSAFLALTWVAWAHSRVLLGLAGLLALAGMVLYLTGWGKRHALVASIFVVVLVQVGNALYPFAGEQSP